MKIVAVFFLLPLFLWAGDAYDDDASDDRDGGLRVVRIDPPDGARIDALRKITITFNNPVPGKYITVNSRNGNCPAFGVSSSLLIVADFVYSDMKKEKGVCYGMTCTTKDNRTFVITPRFPIYRHRFNNGVGDPNYYTIVGATIHFTVRTEAQMPWKKDSIILVMKPVMDIYGNRLEAPFRATWTIPTIK